MYGAVLRGDAAAPLVLLVPAGDAWDLPGGAVRLTESLEAALMRLIKEGTGVDAGVGFVTGLYQRPELERLAVVFRCQWLSGETTAGEWVPWRELPPGARPTLRLRVGDAVRAEAGPGLRLQ